MDTNEIPPAARTAARKAACSVVGFLPGAFTSTATKRPCRFHPIRSDDPTHRPVRTLVPRSVVNIPVLLRNMMQPSLARASRIALYWVDSLIVLHTITFLYLARAVSRAA